MLQLGSLNQFMFMSVYKTIVPNPRSIHSTLECHKLNLMSCDITNKAQKKSSVLQTIVPTYPPPHL